MHLHPDIQEEINWRVMHLNSKWDSIESALLSTDCNHCDQESCIGKIEKHLVFMPMRVIIFLDVDNEVKCLRKWIKNMESCIQPLNFKIRWTKAELETKALEHQVRIFY